MIDESEQKTKSNENLTAVGPKHTVATRVLDELATLTDCNQLRVPHLE